MKIKCPVCRHEVDGAVGQRVLVCTVTITSPVVNGKEEPGTRSYTHALGYDVVADLFEHAKLSETESHLPTQ